MDLEKWMNEVRKPPIIRLEGRDGLVRGYSDTNLYSDPFWLNYSFKEKELSEEESTIKNHWDNMWPSKGGY